MVILGCVGAIVVLAMNTLAVWGLAHGAERLDQGLIAFGVAVGLVWIAIYSVASYKFFREHRARPNQFSR